MQTMDDFQLLKVIGKGAFGKVSLYHVYVCDLVRSKYSLQGVYVQRKQFWRNSGTEGLKEESHNCRR